MILTGSNSEAAVAQQVQQVFDWIGKWSDSFPSSTSVFWPNAKSSSCICMSVSALIEQYDFYLFLQKALYVPVHLIVKALQPHSEVKATLILHGGGMPQNGACVRALGLLRPSAAERAGVRDRNWGICLGDDWLCGSGKAAGMQVSCRTIEH